MSTPLIVTNIVLAAGALLLIAATLVKIKHFYFGGKSEYFTQLLYSGTALLTISITGLLVAYSQYQVPTSELILDQQAFREIIFS